MQLQIHYCVLMEELEQVTSSRYYYYYRITSSEELPELFLFYQRIQELQEPRKGNEKRESLNSIPPFRRVCWKQEPKGVITYTPKSDMTIHLGVVARGRGW